MAGELPQDILLVEDDPTASSSARSRSHGTTSPTACSSPATVLKRSITWSASAREFAFVILDLKLPKISGHEVLERIRANPRTRHLRVVVLTASGQQDDILKAYDNGANSCIRKPVSFDEFAEAVADLGLYWAVLNTLPERALIPARSTQPA